MQNYTIQYNPKPSNRPSHSTAAVSSLANYECMCVCYLYIVQSKNAKRKSSMEDLLQQLWRIMEKKNPWLAVRKASEHFLVELRGKMVLLQNGILFVFYICISNARLHKGSCECTTIALKVFELVLEVFFFLLRLPNKFYSRVLQLS